MNNKSEVDLAEHVVSWLIDQHWEVYQEVNFFGYGGATADIVAVRGHIVWIIECKTTLSLAVMEQAQRWGCHYRSVAVPESRTQRSLVYEIAKYFNIGILEVQDGGYVSVKIDSPLMRHNHGFVKSYYLPRLMEEQKTFAKAGNNRGDRFTPYRRTIEATKRFIGAHPGCTLKQIVSEVKTHYPEKSSLSSLRQALATWETSWCEIQNVGNGNQYFIKGASK